MSNNDNYNSQNYSNTQKEEKKPDKRIYIIITSILVVAVFFIGTTVGLLLVDRKSGSDYETKTEKSDSSRSEQAEEDIESESEKKDGASLVWIFEADKENPTKREMALAKSVFIARLNGAGYTEAEVSVDKNWIIVEMPVTDSIKDQHEMSEEVDGLLGKTARLTFKDADDNIVLDGATDIKTAVYEYGSTSNMGTATHNVKLILKPEAVSKIAEATRKASMRADEGKNYISICIDENIISSPRVNEEINSDELVITGNFTPETAKMLASQIKSGQLPFSLKLITKETVSGTK